MPVTEHTGLVCSDSIGQVWGKHAAWGRDAATHSNQLRLSRLETINHCGARALH
jgi:hypothetical protein